MKDVLSRHTRSLRSFASVTRFLCTGRCLHVACELLPYRFALAVFWSWFSFCIWVSNNYWTRDWFCCFSSWVRILVIGVFWAETRTHLVFPTLWCFGVAPQLCIGCTRQLQTNSAEWRFVRRPVLAPEHGSSSSRNRSSLVSRQSQIPVLKTSRLNNSPG